MNDRLYVCCLQLAILGFTIACNLPLALADDVHLKNDDRLTGTIMSVAKGRLRLATDYAGELSIRLDAVTALRSDRPVVIQLQSGERLIGWLESDGGKESIFLSASERRSVLPTQMLALRPLTDDERQPNGVTAKPALWKHRLEMGGQVRSGNTDSVDGVFSYQGQRQSTTAELSIDVGAAYGKAEDERTAQNAQAGSRLDLLHTQRFFSFYLVALHHDALEELDLRAQELAGVGYKFILTPRTLLQGEVGFGVQEELFENGDLTIEPIGRIGGKWTQKIGSAAEFSVRAAFLPNLIDLGEYRMEGEASVSTPLSNRFLLRFSLIDSFDSHPQPGVEMNDLTLVSSIVWTF